MVKCSECGKDMKRVRNLSEEKINDREITINDLGFLPYELYKNPKLLDNNYIFGCVECRYIRKLGFIERKRYELAEKILGDKI